ncbi:sulfatase-like hydrolase/transferase [Neolewinella sp.]|uniref:sulfatase-like hydrolase/transferase n=1 Tax=Neolewinella sp. TaxID=2993543 RepID=UPI003B5185C6
MKTSMLGLLCLLLCTCGPAPTVPSNGVTTDAPRPNILFILTDDQGIGDLSLHGNDSISTPNMDALLQSGAKFDRFYVSPVCAPTRASFLSGQYSPRTGAVFVTRRRETMDDGVITVAEHLQQLGYRTGLYGKWHNGATFPYHPGGQGFDEFLGFSLGHFNDYFRGELRDERDEPVPFAGDLTQILTDSAGYFMEQSRQPFFCMLTYQAPHTPVQVADRYWERKQAQGLSDYNAGIYAMVESVDDRIGELLGRLRAAGKLDNTIVVFATDNGPNGDRYRMGLKGTKGQVDEGSVRVPFGIKLSSGHPANGKVFDTPAAHIDLLPTLLDLLGESVPAGLDGVSLKPLLEGGQLPDRYVYAFKQGYDYTGYPGSIRNQRYLYVAEDSSQHELYDLIEDPGQEHNIYTTAGDTGMQLAAHYRDFALRIGRPELVAPPVDLTAAPGPIRLLAHEGEPLGRTHFRDTYGWANDFFVDLGVDGAYWPLEVSEEATYTVTVQYRLDADGPQNIVVETGPAQQVQALLPVARVPQLPVADRVPRKEVYPYAWAEQSLGELTVRAGSERLTVRTPTQIGEETGLWIKSVTLRQVAR